MKCALTQIRRRLAISLIAFASTLTIATAKFELDPQSCGMMTAEKTRIISKSEDETED